MVDPGVLAAPPVKVPVSSRWRAIEAVALVVAAVIVVTGVIRSLGGRGFWFTATWSFLAAVVVLGLISVALDALVRAAASSSVPSRRAGLKAVVIGADLRASTSKAQVALWTYAVLFVLIFLLFYGRVVANGSTTAGAHSASLIFGHVVGQPLQPEYIALLGLPAAAAVATKAMTSAKVATGALLKPASTDPGGVPAGVAELATDDTGQVDLLDLQYLLFNVVTLVYFFVQFFTHISDGLPAIPSTLLTLSGVSTVAYGVKKALESSTGPVITAVTPSQMDRTAGATVLVTGRTLLAATAANGSCQVLLVDRNGMAPLAVDVTNGWSATSIVATLTAAAVALPPGPATVVVRDDAGNQSDPFPVQLLPSQ